MPTFFETTTTTIIIIMTAIRFSTPAEAKTYAAGMKLVAAKLAAVRKPQALAATKPSAYDMAVVRIAAKCFAAAVIESRLRAPAKPKPSVRPAPPATVKTYHRIFHRGLF